MPAHGASTRRHGRVRTRRANHRRNNVGIAKSEYLAEESNKHLKAFSLNIYSCNLDKAHLMDYGAEANSQSGMIILHSEHERRSLSPSYVLFL